MSSRALPRVLSWASRFIAAGLIVQLATYFWQDALAFVLFGSLGGLLTVAGIACFLYWLVRRAPSERSGSAA